MIYWSEFTWEAFATLATGLAAVVAAYLIGRRQVQIQQAQTEIQSKSLRSDLFDRRFSVFDCTEKFIWSVMSNRDFIQSDMAHNFIFAK